MILHYKKLFTIFSRTKAVAIYGTVELILDTLVTIQCYSDSNHYKFIFLIVLNLPVPPESASYDWTQLCLNRKNSESI